MNYEEYAIPETAAARDFITDLIGTQVVDKGDGEVAYIRGIYREPNASSEWRVLVEWQCGGGFGTYSLYSFESKAGLETRKVRQAAAAKKSWWKFW